MFDSWLENNISDETVNPFYPECSQILPCFNRVSVVGSVLSFSIVAGGVASVPNDSAIKKFSEGSRRRMLQYLDGCAAKYEVLITLTYPHGCGAWNNPVASKDDLRQFMQACRRYTAGEAQGPVDGWSMFWVMEFQKNGSIHYHLLSTHRYPKDWVARRWYEICGTEEPRHLAAGTRIERIKLGKKGIFSYLAKYASKGDQKVVPGDIQRPGRFWGVSGLKVVVAAASVLIPKVKDYPMVQNEVETLEKMVLEGERTGALRRLKVNGKKYCVMFAIIDSRETYLYHDQILRVQAAMELFNSRWPGQACAILDEMSRTGHDLLAGDHLTCQ